MQMRVRANFYTKTYRVYSLTDDIEERNILILIIMNSLISIIKSIKRSRWIAQITIYEFVRSLKFFGNKVYDVYLNS